MGFGPGLAVCRKVKDAKTKVDIKEHICFIETIYKIEFDNVFTVPEVEASDTTALQKRKCDKRLEIFEKLREAADAKIRAMEMDIYGELEGRFEAHRRRLGEINVDQLLRSGNASASATASAPTSHRAPAYKPVEVFLGSKPFPWWKI